MKKKTGFLLTLALFCLPAALAAADITPMQPAFVHETPLMVIRFNQPRVDYPMPLYETVGKALKVKPSAVFDVVSVAHRAKSGENEQAYYNSLSARRAQKVLTTLNEMGLPASRVSYTEAIDDVPNSEVRIFVH